MALSLNDFVAVQRASDNALRKLVSFPQHFFASNDGLILKNDDFPLPFSLCTDALLKMVAHGMFHFSKLITHQ